LSYVPSWASVNNVFIQAVDVDLLLGINSETEALDHISVGSLVDLSNDLVHTCLEVILGGLNDSSSTCLLDGLEVLLFHGIGVN
jgi:hypothetical protein